MIDIPPGFQGFIHIEVGAEVTHPPGTTYDLFGNPIPPPDEFIREINERTRRGE